MAINSRKVLLREWLEKKLDEDGTSGLHWVDKEEGIFQLYWLHGNNPNWSTDIGQLHKDWAIHKEHYKQNPDGTWPPEDYPKWKARFRCAISRCKYLEEIGSSNDDESRTTKTFKMYPRKVPQTQTTGISHNPPAHSVPMQDYLTPKPQSEAAAATLVSVSTDPYSEVTFCQNLPETLSKIKGTPHNSLDEYMPLATSLDEIGLNTLLTDSDFDNFGRYLISMETSDHAISVDPLEQEIQLPDSLSQLSFQEQPGEMDLCLWIRYKNVIVGRHYIKNEKGCRIYSPEFSNEARIPEECIGADHIEFPSPKNIYSYDKPLDAGSQSTLEQLLTYAEGGIHICCDAEGSIVARRLGRCRIYFAGPTMNSLQPVLLQRLQPTKVFDNKTFYDNIHSNSATAAKGLSISVLFALGEQWSLTKEISKCRISIVAVKAKCWFVVRKLFYEKTNRKESDMEIDEELSNQMLASLDIKD